MASQKNMVLLKVKITQCLCSNPGAGTHLFPELSKKREKKGVYGAQYTYFVMIHGFIKIDILHILNNFCGKVCKARIPK